MHIFRFAALSLFFTTPILSQTITIGYNITLDVSTCVAPKAYEACQANLVAGITTCLAIASTVLEREACACVDYALQIQCFAEACWNRVYSCEYQSIVFQYFQCSIAKEPVPFSPAPDDAPGSCSCNTGKILHTSLVAISNSETCVQNATGSLISNPLQDEILLNACECCMESVVVTSVYDICPTYSPTVLGLDNYLAALSSIFPWPECGSPLSQYDCVSELDFVPPSGATQLFNPSNTPAAGTLTPSNIAGQLTSPPSGTSFLWSAVGSVYTIIAATPEKAVVTAATTKAGGAATTGTGTGTTTGSAATGAASGGSTAGAKSAAVKTVKMLRVDVSMTGLMLATWCFFSLAIQ